MTDLFITPVFTAVDANGETVAGAQLLFCVTGTTTAKNTFSDAALTTVNPNPVIDDFTGRFGDIFLESGDYKVVLKDADDAVIWTRDPVTGMATSVSSLTDADGDTKILVEETADEDKIRFDAFGTEIVTIASGGMDVLNSKTLGVGATHDLGVGVHVKSGDSSHTVDANADELVVEGSGNAGATILAGGSSKGALYFGNSSAGGTKDAGLEYNNSARDLIIRAQNDNVITLSDGGIPNINDSGNANMTWGLNIDQGGNDNEALTLQSSGDVAHGLTGVSESDSYGVFRKQNDPSGGLLIYGLSESGNQRGIQISGYGAGTDTTKSTAAAGVVEIRASKTSGTLGAFLSTNANAVVLYSSGDAKFIVDQEGDFHYDGADGGSFDSHDDAAIIVTFNELLGTSKNGIDYERMKQLAGLRLMGEVSREDLKAGIRPLVNGAQMQRLLVGNSVQSFVREQIRDTILAQLIPGYRQAMEALATGRNVGSLPELIAA